MENSNIIILTATREEVKLSGYVHCIVNVKNIKTSHNFLVADNLHEAAILGVCLHGLAGDIAANQLSQEGLIAGDIIENLGKAFLVISGLHS